MSSTVAGDSRALTSLVGGWVLAAACLAGCGGGGDTGGDPDAGGRPRRDAAVSPPPTDGRAPDTPDVSSVEAPDAAAPVPDVARSPDARPEDAGVVPDADRGACVPEGVRPCADAPPVAGRCQAGTQTCGPDGAWGACEGRVEPRTERCDGEDDDCDGTVDEDFALGEACEVGVGACRQAGTTVCAADGAVECGALPAPPGDETCNGIDDDCDGEVDEDFALGQPCTRGRGRCRAQGTTVCEVDGALVCDAELGTPEPETCNGIDDDCDGVIDQEDPEGGQPCGSEVGECVQGVTRCLEGRVACEGERGPHAEVCNTLDDDCDGEVDEEPSEEVCNDRDDDCDGDVDEGDPGGGGECGQAGGVCRVGIEHCVRGRIACEGAVGPSAEVCNELDDDCDGDTDEDWVCCEPGPIDPALPVEQQWVQVCPGTFTMGSPAGELGRYDVETPHDVTLTQPFVMQATEVTQRQWVDLMGSEPMYFVHCGENCPVESVSWFAAVAYCNALSEAEGRPPCYTTQGGAVYGAADATAGRTPLWPDGLRCEGYRLPTEAEREYAGRAGERRATQNGDLDLRHLQCERPNATLDGLAWYCANSTVAYQGCSDASGWGGPRCAGPHPVGGKAPNAWGLYDILGNVKEWCWDVYALYPPGAATDPLGPAQGRDRVLRGGGSWASWAGITRLANRDFIPAGSVYEDLGLRPVRSTR